MTEIGSDFANQLNAARVGLHHLAASGATALRKSEQVVIDTNLLGPLKELNFTPFSDLAEAEATYEDLAEALPADEQDRAMVELKIAADRMHIRVMSGEEVAFDELCEGTIGVLPRTAPSDKIEALEDEINALLSEKGMRHDLGSVEKFRRSVVRDPEEVKRRFVANMAMTRQLMGGYIPLPRHDVDPEFIHGGAEERAATFETTPDGEFSLKVNLDPECFPTPGKLGVMALHEVGGHSFHTALWQAGIAAGEISPANGFITMYSPEITQAEAVAQLIEHLLPHILPVSEQWDAAYQARYNRYHTMVTHNAHLIVNTVTDSNEAIKYAVERLPFEEPNRVKEFVLLGRDHAVARPNLACYWPALEIVEPVMDLPPTNRRAAIAHLYKTPMTPVQMAEYVAGAEAKAKADQSIQIAL
jgi:hypothetical protein